MLLLSWGVLRIMLNKIFTINGHHWVKYTCGVNTLDQLQVSGHYLEWSSSSLRMTKINVTDSRVGGWPCNHSLYQGSHSTAFQSMRSRLPGHSEEQSRPPMAGTGRPPRPPHMLLSLPQSRPTPRLSRLDHRWEFDELTVIFLVFKIEIKLVTKLRWLLRQRHI